MSEDAAPALIRVGLIGAGIQRSLSPAMHEQEARMHGMDLRYELIELDHEPHGAQALPNLLRAVQARGLRGVNITYPCKQSVLPLLDEVSAEAAAIGAVNTVLFRDGRAVGYNTDASGWRWGLAQQLPNADLSRVALIGAGGAGAAVADALLRMGAQEVRIFDQDFSRAQQLAQRVNQHHNGARAAALGELDAALLGASGLVHATPTGMDKLPGMALPPRLLTAPLWVSEVVYFPIETQLLRVARACGCAVADGGAMAACQAAGAFEIFTGRSADAARMYAHLRRLLQPRAQ